MSDCPSCGQKARHVMLKTPFDGRPGSVVHVCENDDCRIIDFSERIREAPEKIVAHIRSVNSDG